MKKFKNKWSLDIKGSPSLIKAFCEEVEKLGYRIEFTDELTKNVVSVVSYIDFLGSKGAFIQINSDREFGCRTLEYFKELHLPQNWDLALKLAAEVEEEVLKPEVGKWYKLEDPTKDLFYVTSVSATGVCYGYGFSDGHWISVLVSNGSNCICNEVAFSRRARLATNEEVQAVLTAEAKRRYPIGSKIDQKTAYDGKGGIFTINNHNTTLTFPTHYDKNYNLAISDYGVFNTQFGIWAEIVKEVKVNGYVVTKIDDTTVKVGCKVFPLDNLMNLRDFLITHGGEYCYDRTAWSSKDIQKVIDEFLKM